MLGLDGLSTVELVALGAGALLGGFASGLTGFGYAMVSLAVWLHALPPQVAAPLTVICSVSSQLMVMPRTWRTIQWRRAAPFIFAGIAGIPIGAVLLSVAEPRAVKGALGLFLVGYAAFMLTTESRWSVRWGGRKADAGVGLAGGILGGVAGLSGSIMVVWAALRGWGKDEKRGIFQAFNFSMLAVSIAAHAWQGLHTRAVGAAFLVALPLSLVAANAGHRVYQRLSAQRFDRVVLWLLLLAGLGLLAAAAR